MSDSRFANWGVCEIPQYDFANRLFRIAMTQQYASAGDSNPVGRLCPDIAD